MRKEIIRSLVVWPAAASVTIVAWTWVGTPDGPATSFLRSQAQRLLIRSLPRVWPEPIEPFESPQRRPVDRVDGFVTLESPPAMAELTPVERAEQGSRAMKLPSRLVDVYTPAGSRTSLENEPRLVAPIRNEQHEIAGLVLRPPRVVQETSTSGQPVLDDVKRDMRYGASSIVPAENNHALSGPPIAKLGESVARNANDATRNRQSSENQLSGALSSVAGRLDTASISVQPPPVDPRHPPQIAPPDAAAATHSLLPKSIQTLGKLDTTGRTYVTGSQSIVDAAPHMAVADNGSQPPDRRDMGDSPAGWPITGALDEQLQSLVADTSGTLAANQGVSTSHASGSTLDQWTADVQSHLLQLRKLPRIGHPQAGVLIATLADLSDEGLQQAETMEDRALQIQWLQACHALARRTAIWEPIWQISSAAGPIWISDDESDGADRSIHATLEQLRLEVVETNDQPGWTRYLMLDELESLAEGGEFDARQVTAQRFLSRLDWHRLKPDQEQWLDRPSVDRLAELVRPWAHSAVDYASLLNQLERQESNAIDLAAIDISGAIQSLRFADSPNAVRVAAALNTHYRNANIRTAISQAMLHRMLPTIEPQTVPVRTRMFGSRIRGVSQIDSALDIELTPSADRWALQLRTLGNVRSDSTGVNGPVAIRTGGNSKFTTATPIEVTTRGVRIGDSTAEVNGVNRLRDVKTDYDGWPLLGSLVKGYAESRFNKVAPRSNRRANRLIREQVVEKVDNQLDEKVAKATEQLGEMVLGPLGRLRLDPRVIDLQTTQQRLLARYRLAGDWQLGAFTPRPRAPRSSLMSIQVHQSALNNTLEQLVPHDELTSIRDMVSEGMETFGFTAPQIPTDIREDVMIQFAPTRPLTVEIEDGQFWVTLRVVRLTGNDRLDLRRFIVRALYKPQVDGMNATLVRDGHLRISGPGMSMRQRLPVRAIFNKVLSPNRPLQLTLPQLADHPAAAGLAISQLELRDGWIAMAISELNAPRIDSIAWRRR